MAIFQSYVNLPEDSVYLIGHLCGFSIVYGWVMLGPLLLMLCSVSLREAFAFMRIRILDGYWISYLLLIHLCQYPYANYKTDILV